jgi:integrative and conjugative element protein (TIGR02256 family)
VASGSGLPKLSRGGANVITFPVGNSGEIIVFTEAVLRHFYAHRQMKWWQAEACGLLFARTEGNRIVIDEATGPYRRGWRSRYACAIPPDEAQREIDGRHALGLHYVGEWHSHPEPVPKPSGRDQQTMQSRVLDSDHRLSGFIFALVGQAKLPLGLTVLVHDGVRAVKLGPTSEFSERLELSARVC